MNHFGRAALALAFLLGACGGQPAEGDESFDFQGKFLMSPAPGRRALPVSTDSSTEVWKVTAAWSDTATAAAQAPGMAWGASSGLRWDEKFSRWVESMPAITGSDGRRTFQLTTPYGKTLPMPTLECSEVALMLRAVFASWYGLPFFVEGGDASGRLFLGHFGFRTAAGRYKGSPSFKLAYADYSARGSTALASWPKDAKLRARHLTDADGNDFLEPGAGLGAWADEALLNKRVGWFLLYLLDYFGSMNLADGANAYHLKPEALRTGDFLLERWQKNGIGHTLLLKEVNPLAGGKLAVELASGSMPRRQPLWIDAGYSRSYFMSDITGGPGNADDGSPYAKLGGGLRRYRVAQAVGGYWINEVPAWDAPVAIAESEVAAIAARPARFGVLLGDLPPVQKRALLLSELADARNSLRQHPSSCTSRTRREAFFAELVVLQHDVFGVDAAETSRQYRATDDYYFPELRYGQSPTCCWNSTTPQMYSLVDRYNRALQSRSAACLPPVPFTKAHYAAFKAYAQSVGEAASWKEWSEDEPCAQKAAADDAQAPAAAVDYCSVKSALDAAGR